MRIVVAPEVRADAGEVSRLVREAFGELAGPDAEVHVIRASRGAQPFTGLAFPEPPNRKMAPGARYLVRLRLPSILRNRGYPMTHRYRGRKTAPWITVRNWQERLVALAAHEACHVRQFRDGTRRSEVEAERHAAAVLAAWVETRTTSPQGLAQLTLAF